MKTVDNMCTVFADGHRASTIILRGKPDSVYIDCYCGKKECVGVWFTKAPPNWNSTEWEKLRQAIMLFLEYGADVSTATPADLDERNDSRAEKSRA